MPAQGRQTKNMHSEITQDYVERSLVNRFGTLGGATMNMVAYFMGLGDDQATAEDKVGQISDEASDTLFRYILGRTQPLIDAVNASTLPFMDQAAKDELIGHLTTA